MKDHKNLIVILLLLPFSLNAQTQTSVFKGAKRIIVKTDLSAREGFTMALNKLLDNGYEIQAKDDDVMFVRTDERNHNKAGASYYVSIRAKDDELILAGKCTSNLELSLGGITSTKRYFDIEYKSNNSVMRDIFKHLEDLAISMEKQYVYSL